MTKWRIVFTEQGECDLRNIYEYIAFSLLEPAAAKNQVGRIAEKIQKLEMFPMRRPAYDVSPWREIGLRTLLADNYSVLYLTDERDSIVTIVRIMYSGRSIETELIFK